MNESTSTSQNDLFQSGLVGDRIIDEIRPYMVSRPFFRFQGRLPTNSFSFTLNDDPGAADTSPEAVVIPNTQLTTSAATATVSTVGMMATVTDELMAVSMVDVMSNDRDIVVRSVGEKYETDFTALYDNFANTTGTSGSDYTLQQMVEAKGELIGRDATGQLVQVLHTRQTNDLEQDIATTGATIMANPNISIGGVLASGLGGFWGAPLDIPTFHTTLVPTMNGGADRGGAMFVAGVALGLYEIWGTRVEFQRDADLPGTEIVVTARYGVVEVRDVWGETVATDA